MERGKEFKLLMRQRFWQSKRPFGIIPTEEEARRIAEARERKNPLTRLLSLLEKRFIRDIIEIIYGGKNL